MRKNRRKQLRSRGSSTRLTLEPLEDRRLLTITVDTLVDELDFSIVDGDISLRDAMRAAAPGEQIDFAVEGTIELNLNWGSLIATKDLTINGPGSELLTIDGGFGYDGVPATGDGHSIFFINDNMPQLGHVTLRGMTLRGGDIGGGGGGVASREALTLEDMVVTDNAAFTGVGGGVAVLYGNLAISDSTITNNSTHALYGSGGGVFGAGSVTITDSVVSNNETKNDASFGGGIFADALTLTRSTVTQNATSGFASFGGGLNVSYGGLSIVDSEISGNRTLGNSARGGGIYVQGNLRVEQSSISNNETLGTNSRGGGIYSIQETRIIDSLILDNTTFGNYASGAGIAIDDGPTFVTDSDISGNTASATAIGGGIYAEGNVNIIRSQLRHNEANNAGAVLTINGELTVVESEVKYNTAQTHGGLNVYYGNATIADSILSGNTAIQGAGSARFQRDASILRSTIANNAGADGAVIVEGDAVVLQSTISNNAGHAGVVLEGTEHFVLHSTLQGNNRGLFVETPFSLALSHSIVANSTTFDLDGEILFSAHNNLVENPNPSSGVMDGLFGNIVGVDPLLGPLADNGGFTLTHRPLTGSPVVNNGDPNFDPDLFVPPLDFDQRGLPFDRVVDGLVDIGAVEVQIAIVDGDFDDDGNFDCADIDALVAEIVAGNHSAAFDLTGDGLVDIADRDAWLMEAGELNLGAGKTYLLGDATLDGVVDGLDFIQWNTNKFSTGAGWCGGDFTADGSTDGQDFIEWNDNKFTNADLRVQVLAGLVKPDTEEPVIATPIVKAPTKRVEISLIAWSAEPLERSRHSPSMNREPVNPTLAEAVFGDR